MNRLSVLLFFTLALASCSTTKQQQDTTSLFKVGEWPISSDEFIYVYSKNNFNRDSAYSENDIKEYLDLFINFKLKVTEAKALGLDTAQSFKTELEGYRKQLAKPYLTESQVTEKLVKEAYERLKLEVNAAHILLNVKPYADPQDTLKIFNQLLDIRERIINGEDDFASMAAQYSQDPSAKKNKGDLGYFSSMQMVYPFEDAAYKLKVGDISAPVKTRFGYHLIKVKDKRPSRGKVKVAHIMIRATSGISESDAERARRKIFEIHDQLSQGAEWGNLCKQFSEDLASKNKGGELPLFGTGNVDPDFETAAFTLDEIGSFSTPVKTAYGWHIIKLIEKRGIEKFEELEQKIKERISRDSRAQLNKKVLIDRLKKENGFVANDDNVQQILAKADSSLLTATWKPNGQEESEKVLFQIKDQTYTIADFFSYIEKKQRPRSDISPHYLMKSYYNDFQEKSILSYEEDHLAEKYVDYKMLLKEYHEGILLFQLMDEKVWSYATQDTVGLKDFFEKNRNDYQWKERAKATIYDASKKEIIDELHDLKFDNYFKVPGSKFTVNGADQELVGQLTKKIDELTPYLKETGHLHFLLEYDRSKLGNVKVIDSIQHYINSIEFINKKKLLSNDRMLGTNGITFHLVSHSSGYIEEAYNKESELRLRIEEGVFEKDENPLLGEIEWGEGTSLVEKNGRFYFVDIQDILPPSPKELKDIKGLVISDYQNYLEKIWIGELKEKYPVTVNEEELNKVLKKLENN
ncbi:peptidylprolyl isomerase [Fulvivirgaceae bacterium BMA10]|uniref:Peptidylprolyl isomerase n=1 Tax=Splendidivirga corallicola TaxID=3051826 RepID=A0ABT8KV39_9BACT|nr:peptidylprolyl isomerase [Fulvivirgaceae bacterium BMA10]